MKALSVRQPWAWFIVNGHKDIENRTWAPSDVVIGKRILIHAGQRKMTRKDFELFLEYCAELKISKHPKSVDDFDYGAVVGSVLIDGVTRSLKTFWALPKHYHWRLSDGKRTQVRRMKGRLQLFEVKARTKR